MTKYKVFREIRRDNNLWRGSKFYKVARTHTYFGMEWNIDLLNVSIFELHLLLFYLPKKSRFHRFSPPTPKCALYWQVTL